MKYRIDGYYIPSGEVWSPVREERKYEADTDGEALRLARKDGLVRPLMIEIPLGEPQQCLIKEVNLENLSK